MEDEETVRRVAARVLTANGYRVITARDGFDALEQASKLPHPVDLLLTDVVMPRMDGRTLAETLLRAHPDVGIIYASGYTDDAVVRHGVQRATVHFLQKPYTVNELLNKVRLALDTPAASERQADMAAV